MWLDRRAPHKQARINWDSKKEERERGREGKREGERERGRERERETWRTHGEQSSQRENACERRASMSFLAGMDALGVGAERGGDGGGSSGGGGGGGGSMFGSLASFAQSAVSQVASQVERRIDRALDISEEESSAAKAAAAQRRGNAPRGTEKEEEGEGGRGTEDGGGEATFSCKGYSVRFSTENSILDEGHKSHVDCHCHLHRKLSWYHGRDNNHTFQQNLMGGLFFLSQPFFEYVGGCNKSEEKQYQQCHTGFKIVSGYLMFMFM